MGYNRTKQKMKKMFLLIVSLFCVTMAMNAQDASGSCKLPGANDYVNVDFYKGAAGKEGNIVLSNQTSTEQYLTEIKVVVTADILYTYEDVIERGRVVDKKPLWKTVTLFDDKVRDIGANQTRRVAVTMPVYYKIRDIKVSVGNLICN